jgi:hypothetical protein
MYYPDIFLEGLKKTAKTLFRIAGVPADIGTSDKRYKFQQKAVHFFLFTRMQTARTMNVYDAFALCIYSQLEVDVRIIHTIFIKTHFRFTYWGNPSLTFYLFSLILIGSCIKFREPLSTRR